MRRHSIPISLSPKDIDRFWSKVDRSGGPNACWPWTGSMYQGYGRFHVGGKHGKVVRANRVVLVLSGKIIGEGIVARHDCDNPSCCNPNHIIPGSQAENNADMARKGRVATGDRHGTRTHPESYPRGEQVITARLTAELVRAIRLDYATGGRSISAVAATFGVSKSNVGNIILGKRWAHTFAIDTAFIRGTSPEDAAELLADDLAPDLTIKGVNYVPRFVFYVGQEDN